MTISVPDKMPKKSDTITSLVTKASTIVKIGGMMPHIPKLVIIILQPDMTEWSILAYSLLYVLPYGFPLCVEAQNSYLAYKA